MTKRILLILLMSLLVNCSIHSQTTISGIVISIENNQPVSGANITVNGFTTGCTSDQSGKFSITGSFPSKIKIRISHLGFDTKEKTISTDNNKAVELQIILTPVNYLLEEVTVKASSGRGTDLTVPQKVDIIDRGKIMLHPSTQIDQALEYIGGVNVERDFGIYSDKVSVSLRGAGSGQSRTLVVLDGIPLNKTDGGGVNWNMINKDLVRDIRVIKGPGNAKYGSNAMGGVIEISTGIPEKPIAGKIRLRGGTYRTAGYDTHLEGLITNTRDSQYFWNFNHNVTRSDGYINIPDELITAADTFIVPSFLREYSAEFQAGYKAKKSIATVSFSFYDDKRGKGFKAFEDDGGYSEHDTYSSIARYKANAGKTRIFCFVYTIHENYRRMNEYMQDGEYKLYEVDSKRDDRGAKCYAERMFAGHLFTAGMEYKHGAVDGSDIYYTSTDLIRNKGMMDIFSVYIQDDFKLLSEKIDINLGIRQDYAVFHHGLYTIEDPSYSIEYLVDYQQESIPARRWDAISPKFAAQYHLSKNNRIYISAGRGFRAPELDDMCRSEKSNFGFRMLNPDMGPEYLANYETGFDLLLFKKMECSVSAFYSAGNDFIYTISTSDSVNMGYTISPVFVQDNISKVVIYGMETSLRLKAWKNSEAFINYTFTHPEIMDFEPRSPADFDLTGKFLSSVPFHKITAGASYSFKKFVPVIFWKYTGQRYLNDRNIVDNEYFLTDRFPAYSVLDARLSVPFRENFSAGVSIENILNKKYNNSKAYLCPGRFILFEITAKL